MPSSPPGSLTVFSVWAGRSRLPRTQGLRSRPHPGPGAFAQAAPQASQLRLSCSLIDGGILRPDGRAAPRPAPIGRPRPSKACRPLRSSVFFVYPAAQAAGVQAEFCVCPSATRPEGSLRLPAAPAGCSPAAPRFRRHSSANSANHTFDQPVAPRWSGRSAALARKRPNPASRPD